MVKVAPSPWTSRRSRWANMLLFTLATGCLNIERTPSSNKQATDASAPTADASYEVDGGYSPNACVQSCIDRTPAGGPLFARVGACYAFAKGGDCSRDCNGADAAVGSSLPTCNMPGVVDPIAACSTCIKDHCCGELTGCLTDTGCLTIGICASGCP